MPVQFTNLLQDPLDVDKRKTIRQYKQDADPNKVITDSESEEEKKQSKSTTADEQLHKDHTFGARSPASQEIQQDDCQNEKDTSSMPESKEKQSMAHDQQQESQPESKSLNSSLPTQQKGTISPSLRSKILELPNEASDMSEMPEPLSRQETATYPAPAFNPASNTEQMRQLQREFTLGSINPTPNVTHQRRNTITNSMRFPGSSGASGFLPMSTGPVKAIGKLDDMLSEKSFAQSQMTANKSAFATSVGMLGSTSKSKMGGMARRQHDRQATRQILEWQRAMAREQEEQENALRMGVEIGDSPLPTAHGEREAVAEVEETSTSQNLSKISEEQKELAILQTHEAQMRDIQEQLALITQELRHTKEMLQKKNDDSEKAKTPSQAKTNDKASQSEDHMMEHKAEQEEQQLEIDGKSPVKISEHKHQSDQKLDEQSWFTKAAPTQEEQASVNQAQQVQTELPGSKLPLNVNMSEFQGQVYTNKRHTLVSEKPTEYSDSRRISEAPRSALDVMQVRRQSEVSERDSQATTKANAKVNYGIRQMRHDIPPRQSTQEAEVKHKLNEELAESPEKHLKKRKGSTPRNKSATPNSNQSKKQQAPAAKDRERKFKSIEGIMTGSGDAIKRADSILAVDPDKLRKSLVNIEQVAAFARQQTMMSLASFKLRASGTQRVEPASSAVKTSKTTRLKMEQLRQSYDEKQAQILANLKLIAQLEQELAHAKQIQDEQSALIAQQTADAAAEEERLRLEQEQLKAEEAKELELEKERERQLRRDEGGIAIQTSSQTLPAGDQPEHDVNGDPIRIENTKMERPKMGMAHASQQLTLGDARVEDPRNALHPNILVNQEMNRPNDPEVVRTQSRFLATGEPRMKDAGSDPKTRDQALDCKARDMATDPMYNEKGNDPKMRDTATDAWKRDGGVQTSKRPHEATGQHLNQDRILVPTSMSNKAASSIGFKQEKEESSIENKQEQATQIANIVANETLVEEIRKMAAPGAGTQYSLEQTKDKPGVMNESQQLRDLINRLEELKAEEAAAATQQPCRVDAGVGSQKVFSSKRVSQPGSLRESQRGSVTSGKNRKSQPTAASQRDELKSANALDSQADVRNSRNRIKAGENSKRRDTRSKIKTPAEDAMPVYHDHLLDELMNEKVGNFQHAQQKSRERQRNDSRSTQHLFENQFQMRAGKMKHKRNSTMHQMQNLPHHAVVVPLMQNLPPIQESQQNFGEPLKGRYLSPEPQRVYGSPGSYGSPHHGLASGPLLYNGSSRTTEQASPFVDQHMYHNQSHQGLMQPDASYQQYQEQVRFGQRTHSLPPINQMNQVPTVVQLSPAPAYMPQQNQTFNHDYHQHPQHGFGGSNRVNNQQMNNDFNNQGPNNHHGTYQGSAQRRQDFFSPANMMGGPTQQNRMSKTSGVGAVSPPPVSGNMQMSVGSNFVNVEGRLPAIHGGGASTLAQGTMEPIAPQQTQEGNASSLHATALPPTIGQSLDLDNVQVPSHPTVQHQYQQQSEEGPSRQPTLNRATTNVSESGLPYAGMHQVHQPPRRMPQHPLQGFKGEDLEAYYTERQLKPEVEREIMRGFFEIKKKFAPEDEEGRVGDRDEEVQTYVSHATLHGYHPIFSKFAIETVKTILHFGQMVYLNKGQTLYQPGFNDHSFYIVLFGRCRLRKAYDGVVDANWPAYGGNLTIGWTMGEEILFKPEKNAEGRVVRNHACHAVKDSCVLGIEKRNLIQIKKTLYERAQQDEFAKLEIVLRGNHLVKQQWQQQY